MSEPNGQVPENNDENDAVGALDADTSKNSSIGDLETALKEIEKLRKENAAKRVKNKETESELEEFRKWKDSQKTELERLQEAKEAAEKELVKLRREGLRNSIGAEFKLDPDLYEFITGADEEEMRARAEKLAGKVKLPEAAGPQSTYAGNRGTYVAGSNKRSLGGLFLEELAKDF